MALPKQSAAGIGVIIPLAALLLLGGVCIGYVLGYTRTPDSGRAPRRAPGSQKGYESALRVQRPLARGPIDSAGDASRDLARASTEDDQAWPRSPQDAAPPKVDQESAMRGLIAQVQREQLDAAWARESEGALSKVIDRVVARYPDTLVVDTVRCASTRCVVLATATTPLSGKELIDALTMSVHQLPRARIRQTQAANGQTMFQAILARPGYNVEGKVR